MKQLIALSVLAVSVVLPPSHALPKDGGSQQPAAVPALEAPVPDEIPIVLLADLSSGQTLFMREANRRFVPASVTKVMTAYTAFDLVDQGKLPLSRKVIISEQLADEWSGEGSTMFLQAGEQPTIGDLLAGITTVSANDGAVALAVTSSGSIGAWLAMMNAKARQLGMRDTYFGTANGWPDEGRTFTTAHDLAILADALTRRHPVLYRWFFGRSEMTWRNITQSNHDPITGRIEGADGIKTGFTRQSGFNFLGSAKRDGRRLVMILAGAPSARLRDDTARKLMQWGFAEFDKKHLLPGGVKVGQARVQDGAQGDVVLETRDEVMASLPKGSSSDAQLTVRYRGPVQAPIAKGQVIGSLRVSIAGQDPFEVPLVAGEAVSKANAFQRVYNSVRKAVL